MSKCRRLSLKHVSALGNTSEVSVLILSSHYNIRAKYRKETVIIVAVAFGFTHLSRRILSQQLTR